MATPGSTPFGNQFEVEQEKAVEHRLVHEHTGRVRGPFLPVYVYGDGIFEGVQQYVYRCQQAEEAYWTGPHLEGRTAQQRQTLDNIFYGHHYAATEAVKKCQGGRGGCVIA